MGLMGRLDTQEDAIGLDWAFLCSVTWESGPSLSKGLGSVVDIIQCDLSTAVLMLNFIVYPAEPVT